MPKRLLAPLLLLLATTAQAGGEFYCCQDPGNGRRVCGDALPDVCRGRAYRLLDSAGNVIKEVGPPLSPEEKALAAAESRRKKKLEEADREQRRRDQALLDTYALPQDIDLAQRKAEADVNFAIAASQAKIDVARKKRKKFEAEAEFYKKKTLPPELEKELRAIDHEIKLEQELLDIKKHDFETIKTKYDADRKRYNELTGRAKPAAPFSGAAQPQ
ncbi:hypothetical protein [Dechloromonas hortensis]|uniref:hypothetical protein n=1 Tax=Dechloromonas hortensis TaxID=337779 RepID=UPI001290FD96|nr:hypothetical protein [Dechloromonas hortensis]